ncbi:E3 ubiquitin-protein ligase MARCHF2-like isoform X1 [Dermacentor albipictus]|uniref:E3 ubiquitin-protein ligase MARCHF2-like isoform X1 n=1 Tax=Dermacentor albipictus TaxID=60249 RepID=UPI0031FCC6D9
MAERGNRGHECPEAQVVTPPPSPAPSSGPPVRVCRFCRGTNDQLCMVKPCRCTGDLSYAHANCIAIQVFQNNLYFCPSCHYDFIIHWEQQKSFREWLLSEETSGHQRRLLFNLAFAISMAVVLVLGWIQAARALARLPRLIAFVLAIFLMVHTASWIGYAFYNFWLYRQAYLKWKALPLKAAETPAQ